MFLQKYRKNVELQDRVKYTQSFTSSMLKFHALIPKFHVFYAKISRSVHRPEKTLQLENKD